MWTGISVNRTFLPFSTIWPRMTPSVRFRLKLRVQERKGLEKRDRFQMSSKNIQRLWAGWRKFCSRSSIQQRLFIEAWLWLGLSRLAILVIPFRWIAPFLGQTMVETLYSAPASPLALQISWAVRAGSRYTPWESKCLAQAMAAKRMLKRRGLDSTLYLGLSKDGKNMLSAHAWLRCGDRILTGGPIHRQFTQVAAFGDAPRPKRKPNQRLN